MKHLFLLVLTFNACVVFSQTKLRTHSDQNLGIEISYPKKWHHYYRNPNKTVSFTAMKLENGLPAASLWLHVSEDKKESLDTLTFNYMKLQRKNGKTLSAGETIEVNGRVYYSYTAIENTAEKRKSLFYTTKSGEKFYIMALEAYKGDDFDRFKPDFELILQSLKID